MESIHTDHQDSFKLEELAWAKVVLLMLCVELMLQRSVTQEAAPKELMCISVVVMMHGKLLRGFAEGFRGSRTEIL